MDILVKRSSVPLTLMATVDIQGNTGVAHCDIDARMATVITPYGRAALVMHPTWATPIVLWSQGLVLPMETMEGLFEEIAEHDIPDDHFIRLHRPCPKPGQVG
jgi:hypothetical protein